MPSSGELQESHSLRDYRAVHRNQFESLRSSIFAPDLGTAEAECSGVCRQSLFGRWSLPIPWISAGLLHGFPVIILGFNQPQLITANCDNIASLRHDGLVSAQMLEEWQFIICGNNEPIIRELIHVSVLGELCHLVNRLPPVACQPGCIPH